MKSQKKLDEQIFGLVISPKNGVLTPNMTPQASQNSVAQYKVALNSSNKVEVSDHFSLLHSNIS